MMIFISHSLTFLINSRFPQFCDTDVFYASAPLLPKLHGHFAEFLKCCSPITLAFSARILESDLVRLHNFQIQKSVLEVVTKQLSAEPSYHAHRHTSSGYIVLETASINEISSSVENLTHSVNATILK